MMKQRDCSKSYRFTSCHFYILKQLIIKIIGKNGETGNKKCSDLKYFFAETSQSGGIFYA